MLFIDQGMDLGKVQDSLGFLQPSFGCSKEKLCNNGRAMKIGKAGLNTAAILLQTE